MLRRIHRFHGYNSLRSVYQQGQTVRGSFMSLRFAVRNSQRPYRTAIVVSRKVHKSAVIRNRIRRRLYEIIRQIEPQPPSGFDMVLTVFSDQVAELDVNKLKTIVQGLVKKALFDQTYNSQTPLKHGIVKEEGK